MSPVHSIQRRPAHSGALFSRLPETSPVGRDGDGDVPVVGGVEPGAWPPASMPRPIRDVFSTSTPRIVAAAALRMSKTPMPMGVCTCRFV